MKIENKGTRANVLPVGGKMIEIDPGQSVEIEDKAWAALKKRASVAAKVDAGELVEAKAEKPSKADKKD